MSSYLNLIRSQLTQNRAQISKISVVSPHNYEHVIDTYRTDLQDMKSRLDSQLRIEKTAVENSVLIESFTYKAANGTDQHRTVRLSVERMYIETIPTLLGRLLMRMKRWEVLVGCARFNMPIGSAYIGYGFNTGVLMMYFPVDRTRDLQKNFLEFIKSEVL